LTGLSTTNLLLAIIALMVVLQAIAAVVAVVALSRAYRRVVTRVSEIERDVQPVLERTLTVLDRADRISARMDRVSERLDAGTERIDAALTATARGAEFALSTVNGRVRRTAMLATAIARGFQAAREGWRARVSRPPLRIVDRPQPPDLPLETH
jgi:uncharacterized protein YoxC